MSPSYAEGDRKVVRGFDSLTNESLDPADQIARGLRQEIEYMNNIGNGLNNFLASLGQNCDRMT